MSQKNESDERSSKKFLRQFVLLRSTKESTTTQTFSGAKAQLVIMHLGTAFSPDLFTWFQVNKSGERCKTRLMKSARNIWRDELPPMMWSSCASVKVSVESLARGYKKRAHSQAPVSSPNLANNKELLFSTLYYYLTISQNKIFLYV
ncbi:hypothetical protein HBH64_020600 [Parastagonospora nodorum]|nr:hypothetical protein HBI06_062680 [Parastagonospora nodorum]KAH4730087.1 hypothetical protein HBH66_064230 [Parastagonospora nodorum]KAH4757602.1 hypothetical protein HBH64_020600 [Parastagonospora nodorum]KAH4789014.1 hypothetical protein HBH65_053850 [Parastagonospora nodorum]KAH5658571.1 hypothetical protein HBI51_014500 [Parastagonospora nodorum]